MESIGLDQASSIAGILEPERCHKYLVFHHLYFLPNVASSPRVETTSSFLSPQVSGQWERMILSFLEVPRNGSH